MIISIIILPIREQTLMHVLSLLIRQKTPAKKNKTTADYVNLRRRYSENAILSN